MNDELSAHFVQSIDASHAAGLLDQDRRIVQVFHLVTHGTHHRTQFISMLRMLGKDPPFEAGDFAGWQRSRAAQSPKKPLAPAPSNPFFDAISIILIVVTDIPD